MASGNGALMLVATLVGPTIYARIGLLRALNHGTPSSAAAPRRRAKAFWIVR